MLYSQGIMVESTAINNTGLQTKFSIVCYRTY
jgi:hypothetical protein